MPNYTNTKSIDDYYAGLKAPIEANMKQAENDYNYNLDRLRTNKEGQDAQAYRALQRQLKTVPDEMSAAGAQGGMVDSGIAYIKNRYLQGRNDRDTQLAADNAALGRDYQNTLEGYRGQLAKYEQQAAADRAELEYQQALAAARGGGGGGGSYRRGSGSGYYSGGGTSDNIGITESMGGLNDREKLQLTGANLKNSLAAARGSTGGAMGGAAGVSAGGKNVSGSGTTGTFSNTASSSAKTGKYSNLIDLDKYTKD